MQTHLNLPSTFLKFTWFFLKAYRWALLGLFVLASLTGVYGTFISYLIKVLIDTMVAMETSATSHPELIVKASIGPAILFVLNYEIHDLLWRGVEYINLKTAPKIKNTIIEHVFAHLHQHSMRFFQDHFSGALSHNIMILVDNVEKIVHNSLLFILTTVVQLGVALIAMYSVNAIFAAGLLVWVGLFLSIRFSLAPRARLLSHEYAQSQSLVSGKIVDSVQGIGVAQLFGRSRHELLYLRHYLHIMRDKFVAKEGFVFVISLCQGLLISVLISFMLFFLVTLRSQNLVSIGDFALILGLVLTITKNMWTLTKHIDAINDSVGKCNQSLTQLLVPLEMQDNEEMASLVVGEGKIEFKAIQFHYKGDKPLFENQSLTLFPGQRVGLVGYSGSGKTTFVHLILRLFEVTQGAIFIDGQNIQSITQASLRNSIGMIPQNPGLFHRTIMDNIRYGRLEASDVQVMEAARKAQAHDFIMSLPFGYDTIVGEGGMNLSGGQRQRISIARAILKNAPILILDEATSQLDSVTENDIKDSFWTFMKGKTTLVIAHRLSTLLHMDRIIVFDQGQIVQDGTHSELLAQPGLYHTLWEAQQGGRLPEGVMPVPELTAFALDY